MTPRDLIWANAGIVHVSRFDYLKIGNEIYCGTDLSIGDVLLFPFRVASELIITFKSDQKAEYSGFTITYKRELIRE